jgi:hypothetical protein
MVLFSPAVAAATGSFGFFLFDHRPGLAAGGTFFGFTAIFLGFAAFLTFKNSHRGLLGIDYTSYCW